MWKILGRKTLTKSLLHLRKKKGKVFLWEKFKYCLLCLVSMLPISTYCCLWYCFTPFLPSYEDKSFG